jgi:hypothetical protein
MNTRDISWWIKEKRPASELFFEPDECSPPSFISV